MKAFTSLAFPGNCREAFETYARITGGKVAVMITYAETPMADQTPADKREKIIHARVEIGDSIVMGSDPPAEFYSKPHGMSVMLTVDTPEEAERIFAALAEGGEIEMPMEQTFFASRFGSLRDKFGIPWMVGCVPMM